MPADRLQINNKPIHSSTQDLAVELYREGCIDFEKDDKTFYVNDHANCQLEHNDPCSNIRLADPIVSALNQNCSKGLRALMISEDEAKILYKYHIDGTLSFTDQPQDNQMFYSLSNKVDEKCNKSLMRNFNDAVILFVYQGRDANVKSDDIIAALENIIASSNIDEF
jgi:hypothetical protein